MLQWAIYPMLNLSVADPEGAEGVCFPCSSVFKYPMEIK